MTKRQRKIREKKSDKWMIKNIGKIYATWSHYSNGSWSQYQCDTVVNGHKISGIGKTKKLALNDLISGLRFNNYTGKLTFTNKIV